MDDESPLRILDQTEIVRIIAAAIRDGGGGGMTRMADAYLAGVCAEHIADRLLRNGVVYVAD
jgi:hypothetical protein